HPRPRRAPGRPARSRGPRVRRRLMTTMTASLRRLACALTLLAAVPAVAQTSPFYVVQSGDTLFRIARAHDLSLAELRRLNGLDSDVIRVGQRLVVRRL